MSETLSPVSSADMLDEIVAHLGAAVMQIISTDDQIIAGHVRSAHELAKLLWRAQK